MVITQGGEVRVDDLPEHRLARRSLQADQGQIEGVVPQARVQLCALTEARQVREDPFSIASVDDEEPPGPHPVHDEVFDHPTPFITEERILGRAGREPARVVRGRALNHRPAVRSVDAQPAHVGKGAEARRLARMEVLGHNARVLDGHEPPGKGGHARAQALVDGREGSPPERLVTHETTCASWSRSKMVRVARERFRVKKWTPGAPPASSVRHWSIAHSTPVAVTASSSSRTRSRRSRKAGGMRDPHIAAIRSICATFVMGMIPGTMGTSMPVPRARSTNAK